MLFASLCAAPAADWTVVAKETDLVIYERRRVGLELKEYKAVGRIDAEPAVVKRVIDDVPEYPRFMPYVKEARVLRSDAGGRVTYLRFSPPLVGERDYTICVGYETRKLKGGVVSFTNRWRVANDLGPAEKLGVSRVKVTEGSWLLEPGTAGHTQATYTVFFDTGGTVPPFVANAASKAAIPRLFAAIRKQARMPKYLGKN